MLVKIKCLFTLIKVKVRLRKITKATNFKDFYTFPKHQPKFLQSDYFLMHYGANNKSILTKHEKIMWYVGPLINIHVLLNGRLHLKIVLYL